LSDDLPKAVARDKNPGSHKTGDGRGPGSPAPAGGRTYKRKLGNYLIDKQLQLRYVAFVTLLSAIISGSLGYMIWRQKARATDAVLQDFDAWIAQADNDDERQIRTQVKEDGRADMEKRDSRIILNMAGAGVGLVIVLSLFLVVMTHKVAGPLFKVGNYFEQMADGRLTKTWPLRRFDMLKDFYAKFQEMHTAVRERAQADNQVVGRFLAACDQAGVARQGELGHELDELAAHHARREKSLS